jgi:hypothetical protein
MATTLISLLAQYRPEDGWIGTWSPGIGDPNFAGWLTVVAYLFAAVLCWLVYRRLPRSKHKGLPGKILVLAPIPLVLFGGRKQVAGLPMLVRVRALWLGFALSLLCLGINKQLDLQTALTEVGRILARDEGWYVVHRQVQMVFIGGVLLVGVWLLRTVALLALGNVTQMRSVLAGMVFLACFVTIRAASFHHIDQLIGMNLAGLKVNWILELGGIGLVIHGAWTALHRPPLARKVQATVVSKPTQEREGRPPSGR